MKARAALIPSLAGLLALPLLLSRQPDAGTRPGPRPAVADPYVAPRGYVCYRAAAPPRIDGKLDDATWQAAPWSEAFVDIEGDRKPRPRFRTRMKMLWDDQALYIGAELEEPHVWATLTRHDSVIFQDNDFEIF